MATLEGTAPLGRTLGLIPRPTALTGFWSWITTVDHKRVGLLYGWSALIFFLVGGIEALLIRTQLAGPDLKVVGADTYNQLVTMHATTMIFMAIMPLSAAFMNYLLPIMIGARDVAFPRLNAFSYWAFLAGAIFLNTSWFLGGAPDAGWFMYAPLTTLLYNSGPGVDFWLIGVQLMGIGTMVSGFNFLVTILNMRAPGMSLMRMPIFVWTTFITSFLIIFSFPSITVALFMLMFDRFFGANFFTAAAGADVVLWQHLFWVFGHPEVYILILPAMGIVSEVLPTFSKKPLFGYPVVVFSIVGIGFLSFAVWSHHMFAVGQGPVINTVFSLTTMAIAIPTGVKIFNWLATMWGGSLRFSTAMRFAVGFIGMFTIGGLSGFMHAAAPSDYQQHDTYFVVAHIHYVLIGGALMAAFAGMYYWLPKFTGRLLDERLGSWHFWLVMVGFNLAFFPFHFLGLQGMPRRIYTYAPEMGWTGWNLASTVGAYLLGVGVLVGLINLWVSYRAGRSAGADPWDGRTLEWSLPSPVPVYNFSETPIVAGRDAFWLRKHPEDAHALGADDALVDRPGGGTRPHRGIHLPSPSYMPPLLALGLCVAAFGGRYHSLWVVLLGIGVAVLAIYGWVFEGEGGVIVEPEGDR